jgi:hypothetical protein
LFSIRNQIRGREVDTTRITWFFDNFVVVQVSCTSRAENTRYGLWREVNKEIEWRGQSGIARGIFKLRSVQVAYATSDGFVHRLRSRGF